MKDAKSQLGGAGLVNNSTHDKTKPLSNQVVPTVSGKNPTDKATGQHTLLGHSPIKAKGKKG